MNHLLLDALRCNNRSRPPIWLMRQAGRCLPSYRDVRAHHSLEELFHHPQLAAELTLMPVQHLGVDAAILFSDILMVAECLGFEVRFIEGKGPSIHPVLNTPKDIELLLIREVRSSLSCVFETIQRARQKLQVPLIGFCGGPFTIASYLIEGGTSPGKELAKTKTWLFSHPESFHLLLKKITEVTITYLQLQIEAGAQVLQIFDSWAHVLSIPLFINFSVRYLKQILEALKAFPVPVILFCRGSSFFVHELIRLHPSAISFDWLQEMGVLRRTVPAHIAVQGNLDPHLLKAPLHVIRTEVSQLMQSMKNEPGFIVNLGHGVLPDTPFHHVKHFVHSVRESQF